GALTPTLGFAAVIRVLHLSIATVVWGSVVNLAAVSYWTTRVSPKEQDFQLGGISERTILSPKVSRGLPQATLASDSAGGASRLGESAVKGHPLKDKILDYIILT